MTPDSGRQESGTIRPSSPRLSFLIPVLRYNGRRYLLYELWKSIVENNPETPIVIREAQPADVPLIVEFIRGIAEYERLAHTVEITESLLHTHLFGERRYAEVFLGYLGDTPAGYALFFHNFSTFTGRPGIYLEDLFVRSEFRGRGIGIRLLKKVAHVARDRNCGRMEWSVLNWNRPAIEFYRSIDAVPMDAWTVFRLTEESIRKLTA